MAPVDILPEFERPPLAEVVLGIQCDPLVGMTAAHLGAVWGLFRKEFPRTEDRPPLLATFERFESPRETSTAEWNFDLFARPPLPRCWFISEAGDEVLQIQQDRWLHNWRRVDAHAGYPRYSKLREKFEAESRTLAAFVAAEGIGEFRPNQCEVTYINHIVADQHWRRHAEAGKLFRTLVDADPTPPYAAPEHIRFDTAYVMKDEGNQPRGRLHVSVVSGFLKEGSLPMFALTLTARGAPIGDGLSGALAFLDLGHQWVVRGFADLTTEQMHALWGKKTR